MDLLSGGDLRYHLGRKRKFSEKQTSKEKKQRNNFLNNNHSDCFSIYRYIISKEKNSH